MDRINENGNALLIVAVFVPKPKLFPSVYSYMGAVS